MRRKKIQISCDQAMRNAIARLQAADGSSVADVVRNALVLYRWAVDEVVAGGTIVARGGNREREVVLPFQLQVK